MNIPKKTLVGGWIAVLVVLGVAPAQAQQRLLTTHVPPAVANGQAPLVSRLSANESLSLAICLPLPKEADLDRFLRDLYDPQSPSYHQYLTVQQFAERFGPSQQDYDAVVQFAQANHLTVTDHAPNRLVVAVQGAAADIERAFHVTMGVYQHPTEGRVFYSPDREPSVNLSVSLLHISGLDNYSLPRPHRHRLPGQATRHTTGSGSGGEFIGSDMRAAYYGGSALTGAGQMVGLFEFAGYEMSDVQAYFKNVSQPLNVPVIGLSVDGTSLSCNPSCDDSEQVLDIDQAISMAPGLSAVIVYVGSTDPAIFNRMASDNIAKELSCSWGWAPDPGSLDPIFKEFAAQGQTLFVASADDGAYTSSNSGSGYVWPADDPNVTAVGGTDLTTHGAGGSWASEISWNGSGGGHSPNGEKIPSYQTPVIDAANNGSPTLRNVPDVAAEANTDNYFYFNGTSGGGDGGTSYAAPRWAGFMALVNEQATANGKPLVGFLNPTLYAIGQSSSYDSNFHDITSGNNDCCGQSIFYSAVPGYDLVTGWGSPNGLDLIDTLAGTTTVAPNFALSASPSSVSVAPGAIATSTITVSATGGFNGSVSLTAAGLPSGTTASFTPSSVTGGSGSSTLNVSTSSTTPAGAYSLTITGADGNLTNKALVSLTVSSQPQAAAPVFTPGGGSYTSTQNVTIITATSGASIRYTTDGSTPSETAGTLYSGPVNISATVTLKAIAYESGFTDSSVTSATYTIGPASSATINDNASGIVYTGTWTYSANRGVGDYQNDVHYTKTNGDSLSYAFTGTGFAYITEKNTDEGNIGVYLDGVLQQTVSCSSTTRLVQQTVYSTAGLASGSHTLKLVKSSGTYMLVDALTIYNNSTPSPVAPPVFSPIAGTYSSAQSITITTSTSGATIRYTTDGSTPTETHGTTYSGLVNIGSTTTLEAIAYAAGFTDSNVTSATYTIAVPQVAAPVFSPASGAPPLAVTITSATGDATIRYTTDGSTPSETNGTVYPGTAVSIGSSPTTLQAIAYEAGFADSKVTSVTYASGPPPTFNFEAESMSPVGTGATVSTSNDANASGGVIEFLNSTAVGQSMTLTTPSLPAGTYQVQFRYKTNTSRAQHNVVIDGTQVGGTIDQYATTSTYPTATLGNVTFATTGTHTIVLTVTDKDAAATHFYITVDKFAFVGQ